jgi:hypothetical protein
MEVSSDVTKKNIPQEYATIIAKSVSISCCERNNILHVTRSVRDIDNDTSRSFYSTYFINNTNNNSANITPISLSIEVPKLAFDVYSKSGEYNIRAVNSDEKSVLEIYRHGSLRMKIDSTDIHRKINGDAWFGGYSFSNDNRYFAYVAGLY